MTDPNFTSGPVFGGQVRHPLNKSSEKSLSSTLLRYGVVGMAPYVLYIVYVTNFVEGDTSGMFFLIIFLPGPFVAGLIAGALANLFTLSRWVPYLAALIGGALPYFFVFA